MHETDLYVPCSFNVLAHHTLGSSFLPSLASDFVDEEDEEEEEAFVPSKPLPRAYRPSPRLARADAAVGCCPSSVMPVRKRYRKFAVYDLSLPIINEEDEPIAESPIPALAPATPTDSLIDTNNIIEEDLSYWSARLQAAKDDDLKELMEEIVS